VLVVISGTREPHHKASV